MIEEVSNFNEFYKIAVKPELDLQNFMKSLNSIKSKKERTNATTIDEILNLFKRDTFRFRMWAKDNIDDI